MRTSLGEWPALVVTNGPQAGRSVTIGIAPVVLGSGPSADLVVDGRGVSRRHAEVYREPDGIFVRDLGSATGTYLGNEEIPGPIRLEPGDVLGLGDVTLRVGMVVEIPRPRRPLSAQRFRTPDVPEGEPQLAPGVTIVLFALGFLLAIAGFLLWMGLAFNAAASTGNLSLFSKDFGGVPLAGIGIALFVIGGVLAGLGQWKSRRD